MKKLGKVVVIGMLVAASFFACEKVEVEPIIIDEPIEVVDTVVVVVEEPDTVKFITTSYYYYNTNFSGSINFDGELIINNDVGIVEVILDSGEYLNIHQELILGPDMNGVIIEADSLSDFTINVYVNNVFYKKLKSEVIDTLEIIDYTYINN